MLQFIEVIPAKEVFRQFDLVDHIWEAFQRFYNLCVMLLAPWAGIPLTRSLELTLLVMELLVDMAAVILSQKSIEQFNPNITLTYILYPMGPQKPTEGWDAQIGLGRVPSWRKKQ
ncbi:hypothetical protein YTPLAS18_26270 [Nitrospira sp.]|nr:hypothetical protein YTPLAS18_26270 [Nitrospira sp.]